MRSHLPVALCLLIGGCGSSGSSNYPYQPQSDGAVRSETGVSIPPSGTVAVEIHSPAADALLSTNAAADVSAKITIQNGTDFIDPASIVISLTAKDGGPVVSTGKLTGPVGDSEYRGKLGLSGLKAGDYTLTVRAASSTGATGEAHVSIKLDAGPQITVISPVPGQHYKSSLIVQLVADAGAFPDLSELQGSIGGVALNLQPAGPPNQFRAVFDFNLPSPALSGEQLFIVSAKNGKGTRTEIRFVIVVDNVGPQITDTTPTAGTIVGGVIRIAATISDDAELNPSSLVVLIGDKVNPQFKLPLNPEANGVYSVLFDTHNLTQCKLPPDTGLCIVFPTLSFRAADQLGNESTVAYEISVDNIPPLADLTPPPIRDSKLDEGLRCSHLFDPLSNDVYSGDMPNDLCLVPQVFDLRARIEDQSNRATGLKLGPISGVDPDATAVYVLDDISQPLIVDTDGDGNCDAINPKLVPTTAPLTQPRQVLKVRLTAVPPVGKADFTPESAAVPAGCITGRDTDVPPVPCHDEQPTIAISYAGGLPAIWGVDPVNKAHCLGGQFDTLANNVASGGWKCIAVGTADLNGNATVSAPIRVWVDYKAASGFCAAPPANAGPPPACTGIYNRAADTTTPGVCKTRKFTAGEICFDGDC